MNNEQTKDEIEKSHYIDECKNLIDIGFMGYKKIYQSQLNIVEAFLLEYCMNNNLKENELIEHLAVCTRPNKNLVAVVDAHNVTDVKLGVSFHHNIEEFKVTLNYELFGSVLDEKEKFPNTFKVWDSLNTI